MHTIEKMKNAYLANSYFNEGKTTVYPDQCGYPAIWDDALCIAVKTAVGICIELRRTRDVPIYRKKARIDRLNSLPGIYICEKSGRLFLNGEEWDGMFTLV